MSDKQHTLRFTPGYMAVMMVGALVATPVLAQTAVNTLETTDTSAATATAETATAAAATGKASTVKKSVSPSVILSDITVDGLERSDPNTVFNILPVKVGERYSKDSEAQIVKSLYDSGLYENVSARLDGSVLKIKLSERPVISEFNITGMKKLDVKNFRETLKSKGFGQGTPYNPNTLEQIKTELLQMYRDSGLTAATVTTEAIKQDRNQVIVNIKVEEGKSTKIRAIKIEGNTHVSSYTIRNQMEMDKNGIFSWYTKDSVYSEERLKSDLENIRAYYYDRGYLDFDFTDVRVTPSAKADGVDINLAVKEGEQYRVSSISLVGDTKGTPRADIEKLVKYNIGSVYSREKISKIVEKIHNRLGEDGYALAQVDVQPKLSSADHTVDVAIVVNPMERVYVRRVNIMGNSRTQDFVIRREVRQMESALFDGSKVQLSRDRIDRLGYFDKVDVDVVPVPGTNNQVDVNYSVNELPTGDLKLGLGYSTSDKVTLSGSITENNFMGSGQSLSVGIDTSSSTRNVSISTTNPYFTKDGISQTVSAYYKRTDLSKLDLSDTIYTTAGLNLLYGIPLSERHRLYLGINPEYNKIELDSSKSPIGYIDFMNKYGNGKNHFMTYALTTGWSYDTRDSSVMPSRGQYQKLLTSVAPFGDLKYYTVSYQYQHFLPLSKRITLALNTQFDYGKGYGGSAFPFYNNYYAGGIGSVRGYDSGTLGPKETKNSGDTTSGSYNYVVGNKRAVANLELQFPFPGMVKSKAARLFVFADAGGVWSDYKSSAYVAGSEGMRYSAGVGLLWASPIGPLKFSYGIPIKKKDSDQEQRFQFQIGTSF